MNNSHLKTKRFHFRSFSTVTCKHWKWIRFRCTIAYWIARAGCGSGPVVVVDTGKFSWHSLLGNSSVTDYRLIWQNTAAGIHSSFLFHRVHFRYRSVQVIRNNGHQHGCDYGFMRICCLWWVIYTVLSHEHSGLLYRLVVGLCTVQQCVLSPDDEFGLKFRCSL